VRALAPALIFLFGCHEVIDLGDELRFDRKAGSEEPGPPPGCPPSRWIHETFDNDDYRREIWREPSETPSGALTIAGGLAHVNLGSDVYHLGRFDALLPLSLRDRRVEVELIEAPSAASGAAFSLLFIVPAHTGGIEMLAEQGLFRVYSWNTENDGFIQPVRIPYDPVAHRFMRLGHADGMISIETSADGASWQERARNAESDYPVALDELLFIVMAFTEEPPVAGQDTAVRFDNITGTLCLPGG
jgi:hypothetical protein